MERMKRNGGERKEAIDRVGHITFLSHKDGGGDCAGGGAKEEFEVRVQSKVIRVEIICICKTYKFCYFFHCELLLEELKD